MSNAFPNPYEIKISQFLSKKVSFQYGRQTLHFSLSQSLFSSFNIDTGSQLLLRSIAQEFTEHQREQKNLKSILDIGSGVGVLGIALAKRYTASLTVCDRDALALAVTAHNATSNNISCTIRGGLDTTDLAGIADKNNYELVVANLPAKAGMPVLLRILVAAAKVTDHRGRIAVVVVTNLADAIRHQFSKIADIINEVHGNRHVVLHGRPHHPIISNDTELSCYRRKDGDVTLAGFTYPLTTVYGLPDFDTPSHVSRIVTGLIKRSHIFPKSKHEKISILCWNPGQGHLLAWLAKMHLESDYLTPYFTIVSRDALQLLVSRANLISNGISKEEISLYHRPTLEDIKTRHDVMLLNPDKDLSNHNRQHLLTKLIPSLNFNASILVYGGSSIISPIVRRHRKYTMIRQSRRRTFRAIHLRLSNTAFII